MVGIEITHELKRDVRSALADRYGIKGRDGTSLVNLGIAKAVLRHGDNIPKIADFLRQKKDEFLGARMKPERLAPTRKPGTVTPRYMRG